MWQSYDTKKDSFVIWQNIFLNPNLLLHHRKHAQVYFDCLFRDGKFSVVAFEASFVYKCDQLLNHMFGIISTQTKYGKQDGMTVKTNFDIISLILRRFYDNCLTYGSIQDNLDALPRQICKEIQSIFWNWDHAFMYQTQVIGYLDEWS